LNATPATATNRTGEEHCVTATIRDAFGNPTPNVRVVFKVSGANNRGPATRATNTGGQATFCYTGTKAGTDTISAFADANRNGTDDGQGEPDDTAQKTYRAAAPATLNATPATATNRTGEEHCVTATIRDAFGNPTPNVRVVFKVSGAHRRGPAARSTNTGGKASFCYTGVLAGRDEITAYADTNRSNMRDAGEPGDTAAKTWTTPASTGEDCEVEGLGEIRAANGDAAIFSGEATNEGGSPAGEEQYTDQGPARRMRVRSTQITALVVSADRTRASIFGKAIVNGGGSFDFRIDVVDLTGSGGTDTYRIRLSNGYDSGEQPLRSGDIVIDCD
jgi:hypothetical protein